MLSSDIGWEPGAERSVSLTDFRCVFICGSTAVNRNLQRTREIRFSEWV